MIQYKIGIVNTNFEKMFKDVGLSKNLFAGIYTFTHFRYSNGKGVQ